MRVTPTMTTINIIHAANGRYTVTINGKVVATGLTNAAAWQEAERLVESDASEDLRQWDPHRTHIRLH